MLKARLIMATLCSSVLLSGLIPVAPVSATQKTGWEQEADEWKYYEADGPIKNRWKQIEEKWYAFDSEGNMIKGWFLDEGNWYYLDSSGAMKTHWLFKDNEWYFMGSDGGMKTGWVKDGQSWYFMNNSGTMKTGWLKQEGKWYFLDHSGAMKLGWLKDGGNWYYLNSPNGDMAVSTWVDGVDSESGRFCQHYLNAQGIWTDTRYPNNSADNPVDTLWKAAYYDSILECVNELKGLSNGMNGALIYIDDDSIPEMLLSSQFTAGGAYVYTFNKDLNKAVRSEKLTSSGVSYIEGSGKFIDNSCRMETGRYYTWTVNNGEMTCTGRGEYFGDYSLPGAGLTFDENGDDVWPIYQWDGEPLTHEEFWKKAYDFLPKEGRVNGRDIWKPIDELIKMDLGFN